MSDSIGARLRQARELRHLTLPQVSESTKLRAHYLQALENDDYSAMPSAAQARGFLRIYAEFLELDLADLLPPAPPEPAPVASAAPVAKPAVAARAPAGWLVALRARFSRPKKEEDVQDLPVSAPADPSAASVDTPAAAEAAVPASSQAQTARRPKSDSTEVKKKAVK